MNKYYFNFRKRGEVTRDSVGMYLPDLDAAREEAITTWLDLQALAAESGELIDCAIEVADASQEAILSIPAPGHRPERHRSLIESRPRH